MTNDQPDGFGFLPIGHWGLVIGHLHRSDWSFLAVLLVAIAGLVGCGESGPRQTVLEFWAMGSEGEKVQPMVEEFERLHPDVRIRVQQIPWTAAHEKLLTAFAGDSLPDVCQLGNTWIAEFAALGAIEDLTGRVADSPAVKPEDFFPGVWQSNVVSGRVYGVPWYVDTRLLFYRTDLLAAAGHDKPPATWDEWLKTMRDVQRTQPEGSYAVLLPTNEFEQPVILGLAAGAGMLKEGGRYGDFESPEFRKAFDFYVGIFREGLAPNISNTRISNVWQEFERGTFAMYVTGPWNVSEFRSRMSPAMQGKWTTAPWPNPAGDGPGASNAGGCSLVMFHKSARQSAAWQFVEFMSTAQSQVEFYRLTTNLPARQDAWPESGLTDDREFAAFHEQLKNVRPMPPVPEWEEIVTGELVKTAEAAINGQVTVDDALARLDRRVNEILDKRRWMLARQTAAAPQ